MPVTEEAAILAKMAERGHFPGAVVDGPLALDLAIYPEVAQRKGIQGEVAGQADLLLCPAIEVGNVLGKSLLYFAHAKRAGIVLGAKAPLILTSRLSTPEEKLNSLAVACLAQARKSAPEKRQVAI
jgi:phosphate butyryltransferase